MQEAATALVLARFSAGNSMAARIAMMAMTTSSSISVNPACRDFILVPVCICAGSIPSNRGSPVGRAPIKLRFDQAEEGVTAHGHIRHAHEAVGRTVSTRPV